MENYIPLKEYAIKNKISIFNTIKLVKANKVEYITKTIDNKEQIFIKEDSKVLSKKTKPKPTLEELYKEIANLKKRIKELEDKVNGS